MRSNRSSRRIVALQAATIALSASLAGSTQAGQLFWDGGNAPFPPANGGSGVWDDGFSPNWAVDASGSGYTTWDNSNPSDAVFDITPGTVTINSASNVTATSVLLNVNGYTISGSGSLTLTGAGTVGVTGAANTGTIATRIAGSVGLTKVGGGSLLLGSSNNSYSGATNINGGTLALIVAGSLPSGNALSASGGALNAGSIATSVTNINLNNGTIAGTGSVATSGAMTVSGGVTMTGNSQIGTTPMTFTSAPTFDVTGTGTLNTTVTATGTTFTKSNSGTLNMTVNATNSYSKILVSSGTLGIVTDRNFGDVPGVTLDDAVTLDGGAIRVTSNLWSTAGGASPATRGWTITANNGTLDVSQSSGNPTLSFSIKGVGKLTKTGTTTIQVTGNDTFNGLDIIQGRWNAYTNNSAGSGPITLAGISGGTANLGIGGATATNVVLSNPVNLSTANGGSNSFEVNTSMSLQLDGKISGAGGLQKGLVVGTSGALLISNHANDYTGDTSLLVGSIKLLNDEVIPDGSNLKVDSGPFDLNGHTETVGGLFSSQSTGTIDLNGGNLIVGASNTGTLVSATLIKGSGNFTKLGTGVQTLSHVSSTWTGNINVSAGTLQVNFDHNLGAATNPLNLDGGGFLRVNNAGFTTTARNITVGAGGGGIDTNGNTVSHTGTITGAGVFRKAGAGALTVNNVRSGGISVEGGTLSILAGRNTANTSVVSSVAVNGGAGLNVNDQDLIADKTGMTLTQLQSLIAAGYNANAWDGSGINSAVIAANNSNTANSRLALGYVDNASTGYTSFSGQTVTSNNLLVRYCLAGDANVNGTVDSVDFNLLVAGFSQPGQTWFTGDFDYNGSVDSIDFNILAGNFSKVLAAPSSSPALGGLVPEPTMLGAISLAAACNGLLRRRRRG
jgi:autotransporter-associated beta strand protein